MINHSLKSILILLGYFVFVSCTENKEIVVEKKDGIYTRLFIYPILDDIQAKSRTFSSNIEKVHFEFQDGDSLLLFNISNGFRSKMTYNSILSGFECDAKLNPNDEISIVYPYKDVPIVSNRILLDTLFQNGYKANHYFWGGTDINEVDSCTTLSIDFFNLCNTCSIDIVDEENSPIAIKAVSLSALKGRLYNSRFLNIRTGSWEEGTYAETINIVSDSLFYNGKIMFSLIPTSALLKGIVKDFKDNSFEGKAEQKIFGENDSTHIIISCTTPISAKEYVVVCGIKWAKGNLQYGASLGTSVGFRDLWSLASAQWRFPESGFGFGNRSSIQDLDAVYHFNWGVCGDNAISQSLYSKYFGDIAGKLFIDQSCTKQTMDFNEAHYGDVAYWASNGKYRMPTKEEMYRLFSMSSYSRGCYVASDGSQTFGFLFKEPENGTRIVETKFQYYTDYDLEHYLFLPNAGNRQANSSVILRIGYTGYYWDSYRDQSFEKLKLGTMNPDWMSTNPVYGRTIRPVIYE